MGFCCGKHNSEIMALLAGCEPEEEDGMLDLDELGNGKIDTLTYLEDNFKDCIKVLNECGLEGRELALVKTKLEEALLWTWKGLPNRD